LCRNYFCGKPEHQYPQADGSVLATISRISVVNTVRSSISIATREAAQRLVANGTSPDRVRRIVTAAGIGGFQISPTAFESVGDSGTGRPNSRTEEGISDLQRGQKRIDQRLEAM
jgi:hypothetical protein